MNKKKTATHQSFLHGAAILVGSTVLVKIIGAIYKIPLGNMIGESGMGYFSVAYDLYLPLYSLAMAGLPIAISRMVAEAFAKHHYKDARVTLKVAQRAFWVTGLAGFFIMVVASFPYVMLTQNQNALYSILVIAPSLFFCCIMSSYRGYYEGMRNMTPTAVSSIIEALGKLVLGLGFAYAALLIAQNQFEATGMVFGQIIETAGLTDARIDALILEAAAPYAAAATVGGITLGTVFSALYLIIKYKRTGDGISRAELLMSPPARPRKVIFKALLAISIPVVLGSLVSSVASLVDFATVQTRLLSAMKSGEEVIMGMYGELLPDVTAAKMPNALYGVFKGFAYNLFNLIPSITSVLGVSALPTLATAWVEKNKKAFKINFESVLRMAALISFPISAGFMALPGPILHLLYPSRPGGATISTPILFILGITGFFAGLSMPLTNMLQSIGKQSVPVRNLIVGVVLKIVINYVLVGIPGINVIGAPIGTLVCYVYIDIMDMYCMCKYSGVMPNFLKSVIKPLISAAFCGVTAFVTHGLLTKLLNGGYASLVTIGSIGLGALIYAVTLVIFRTITKEDILMLPKGERIVKTLEKRRWIG